MKKLLFVFVLLSVAAGFAFSQGIEFSSLPPGKWIDANWNAVWEVTPTNLRILDLNGNVLFEFKGKTNQNFSIGSSSLGPFITFYTEETGKTYKITKTTGDVNVILEIDRPGQPHYMVEMKPVP